MYSLTLEILKDDRKIKFSKAFDEFYNILKHFKPIVGEPDMFLI